MKPIVRAFVSTNFGEYFFSREYFTFRGYFFIQDVCVVYIHIHSETEHIFKVCVCVRERERKTLCYTHIIENKI